MSKYEEGVVYDLNLDDLLQTSVNCRQGDLNNKKIESTGQSRCAMDTCIQHPSPDTGTPLKKNPKALLPASANGSEGSRLARMPPIAGRHFL